jgi:stage III sporulation protein SpoIIIAA
MRLEKLFIMQLANDLEQLLDILPSFVSNPLKDHQKHEQLVEVILDIGRRPEARFSGGSTCYLSYRTILWQDLDSILKRLGKFNGDNRTGIEKTLHRISALRNRQGRIIGLTCRIGRAIFGNVSIVRDLLENGKSILLLGKPGVGKTTAIREIARVLSDELKKRVIIIDTSNEIAGDGDLPHPSIGKARRMQVSNPQNQYQAMIEAVENHMPEIIIIDEIGTELEAEAARTIAERGVQLVGTAHGNVLGNLIKNPTITELVGGIQYVTLGDEEAKRRGSSKSILERKAPSTFQVAVEIHDPQTWVIHTDIEQSVDLLLQGQTPSLQKRTVWNKTKNVIDCKIVYNPKSSKNSEETYAKKNSRENKQKNTYILNRINQVDGSKSKKLLKVGNQENKKFEEGYIFIYICGINNQDLKSLIKTLNLPIIITKEIQYADTILALFNIIKNNKKLRQISHSKQLSIHTIESNSLLQLANALRLIVKNTPVVSEFKQSFNTKTLKIITKNLLAPLEETRLAIEEIVIPKKQILELIPRSSSIRKLQHELIKHYQLKGLSVGNNADRRIRIYPNLS